MAEYKFSYQGKTLTAQVTDKFFNLSDDEKKSYLAAGLSKRFETKIPDRGSDDKGLLDYLALLERPSQAFKVGARESKLGSDIYKALGQVDLTPNEGFFEGFKAGWMGEDEVRTQDFLPENMNPITKGILGFVGDVATDPLTYVGAGAVRTVGGGIRRAGEATGANEALQQAGTKIANLKFGEAQRGLPDLARAFNIPMGEGKKVKGISDQADEILKSFERETAENLPPLMRYFKRRAKDTGVASSKLEATFRNAMERPKEVLEPALYDPNTEKLIKEGVYGNLEALSDDVAEELGAEGVELLDKWAGITQRWVDVSEAYGMPITTIKSKGYFPRQVTPEGRKFLKKQADAAFDVDEFGEPVRIGGGYRTRRTEELRELGIDEANEEMAKYQALQVASVGRRSNPLDKTYEQPPLVSEMPPFFQQSPFVALGMRWSRQNKAIQRKWFVDEITDNYDATIGKTTGNLFVPEKGIGKWVSQDEKGNYLERVRVADVEDGLDITKPSPSALATPGATGVDRTFSKGYSGYSLKAFEDNIDDFAKIKGINPIFLSDEILDQEWRKVFDQELQKKGIFLDLPRGTPASTSSRVRITDDTLENLGAEYVEAGKTANKAREVFKNKTRLEFRAPKQVARQIENQMSLMAGDIRGEKELSKFLKMYDDVQNAWKAWTLGVRPAYHTRNLVGNFLNAYNIAGFGENIPQAIKIVGAAAKLQYYARFKGNNAQKEQVVKNFKDLNVPLGKTKPIVDSEWTKPNYMDTGYSMKEIYDMGAGRGIQAGHYTADNIRDVERAREAAAGVGSRTARIIGAENPAVQAGFAFGGTIEGNARFAVFIDKLRKLKKGDKDAKWNSPDGTSVPVSQAINNQKYLKTEARRDSRGKLVTVKRPYTKQEVHMDIAADTVKQSLFDYGDVSKFERDVFKRVMPFYTWTRKNIPAQLKHLVLNPQRAEKIAIAKQQFEHESGDLDYSDYGQFWGDRVPVFLGAENEGVVQAFTLLNVVPMADLQRLIKPGPLLAEMTSPSIKAPLEILANYDSFRDSKIAKQKPFTGEVKDFLGINLSPRLYHLAQVLVPLAEINRLNPAGVFGTRTEMEEYPGRFESTRAFGGIGASREATVDAPEAARWVRFFSGFTTYDVNLRRQKYFMNKNLKNDIAKLLGAMKTAGSKGQTTRYENLKELLEQVMRQEITDPMNLR